MYDQTPFLKKAALFSCFIEYDFPSFQTAEIGLTETVKNDKRKFELWLPDKSETYTLQVNKFLTYNNIMRQGCKGYNSGTEQVQLSNLDCDSQNF